VAAEEVILLIEVDTLLALEIVLDEIVEDELWLDVINVDVGVMTVVVAITGPLLMLK